MRRLTNVNFHCSPAATVRPDGTYAVEAVTATASFRRPLDDPLVRAHGGESHRGQGRAHGLAYREWFVPPRGRLPHDGRLRLGAAYGKCIKRVREVHWLKELGIAQALWVLEVERLGPFLVEGDHAGRGLFALANREINARLHEVYAGLPPYAMRRIGEPRLSKEVVLG